jgi:hypothetical protein
VCVLFEAKDSKHSFDGFVVDNNDGTYCVSYFPTRCVCNNHNIIFITITFPRNILFCALLTDFHLIQYREGLYSLSVQVNGMELKGFPLDVGMIS